MKRLLLILSVLPIILLVASCGNTGSSAGMSASDSAVAVQAKKDSTLAANKAKALAAVKVIYTNVDEAFKDVAPDAVDYGDGESKPVKNVDSIKVGIKAFVNAFPNVKGENYLVIGDGNTVAVFGDYTGTFKNAFMGMKPTGKSFKVRDCDIFTFNDAGKMTEHRNVQSGMTYFNQVGAKMK